VAGKDDEDQATVEMEGSVVAGVHPPPLHGTSDDGERAVGEGPPPTADPRDAALDSAAPPVAAPEPPEPEPILPTDAWVSPGAQQRQQWLSVALAALAGIVLAVAVIGWLIARRDRDEPAVAIQPPNGAASPAGESPKPSPTPPPDAKPSPESLAGDQPPAHPPASPAATEPAPPADAEPVTPPPAEPPQTEPAPPPDAPKPPAEPDPAVAKTKPDTDQLATTLQAFAPFLDERPYTPPASVEPPAQEQPALDPAMLDKPDSTVPRPEPREVQVEQRLADPLAEIDFQQLPLVRFLKFLTEFSTIPITLDPDALALVQVRPYAPVTLKLTGTTAGAALTAALEPLRLGFVSTGNQLVVTRPAPADGQFRKHVHNVADLVGDNQEQLDRLVEWIGSMVEPEAWDTAGGPGTIRAELPALIIQQRDTVLYRALMFCERLRIARGLPTQTAFAPPPREPRFALARQRLESPVRIHFYEPTPLLGLLDRLSRETKLYLLVDWQAVAELGWNPDAQTQFSAENIPVQQALHQLLDPLQLTYRVIDAETIQITTPEALIRRPDVEFYALGETPAAEDETQLLARLRSLLKDQGVPDAVLAVDASSNHLMAALPQPAQRILAAALAAEPPPAAPQ
jgi:hypothetical protein